MLFDFPVLPVLEALGPNVFRLLCAFALGVFIVNIYQVTHAKIPQKSFTGLFEMKAQSFRFGMKFRPIGKGQSPKK